MTITKCVNYACMHTFKHPDYKLTGVTIQLGV